MTMICKEQPLVTLINIFTVAPEQQKALLDNLIKVTQEIMYKQPGFISANLHKSLDGTKVTNYAQWRSRADFEAMLQNPEVRQHIRQASQIAISAEPTLYEVSFIAQSD
ncbi:antibiotic biosynthesis monooxygenase family protein [Ktedonospora formicarum]|uniref:Antibiotic biosynthesis monooxygenase n=1 Tax=Ktedonospora formicarum TaxID=2778364 RepID=A0A8J3I7K2_9CHLR|nr:antibiotic biosynthesis monooxygenase family protein [Ktedonospora formicarum]GHO50076.1 antibiotic biosynthesis monooxygenase [Ktedonospora formicarum]